MKLKFTTVILLFIVFVIPIYSQELPSHIAKSGLVAWYSFSGNAIDESGNNLNGKIMGAELTEDRFNNKNSAFLFSGKEYIQIDNFPSFPMGYTFSAWIRSSEINEECGIVVQKGVSHNGSYGLSCYKNNYLGRHRNVEKKLLTASQKERLDNSKWHHIASTWNGEQLAFYLDGKLQTSLDVKSAHPYEGQLIIGALNIGKNVKYFYKGQIDDVGVWSRPLTQKEISQLFLFDPNNENKKDKITKLTNNKNKDKVETSNIPIPLVKINERYSQNNLPKSLLVYDKNNTLSIGNTVNITKTDKLVIPGERKPQLIPTIIGEGRVVKKANNVYTIHLSNNTSKKLIDYKDGDKNYFCVKTEEKNVVSSSPRVMVIPKVINQDNFDNGEYKLTDTEKMIITSLKNKLEDNNYTTVGFESILKKIYEDRIINDNAKIDLKAMILESSGSDFYAEFESLRVDKCDKVIDFKISNYANGEDVASDIKKLNTCGSPEEFKNFAALILNQGALTKINSQYASLQSEGRKVSVNFLIKNSSSIDFTKEFNAIRLEEHIETCIQMMSYKGNYKTSGVVNNRMSFPEVSVGLINETTGQNYSPNAFAVDLIKYLKEEAGVECEKTVIGSNINITIK
jgi:hypothetical protein